MNESVQWKAQPTETESALPLVMIGCQGTVNLSTLIQRNCPGGHRGQAVICYILTFLFYVLTYASHAEQGGKREAVGRAFHVSGQDGTINC